jgi:hypothetical protein
MAFDGFSVMAGGGGRDRKHRASHSQVWVLGQIEKWTRVRRGALAHYYLYITFATLKDNDGAHERDELCLS